MRAILLGRKPIACAALRHTVSMGVEVVAVSTPEQAEPVPSPERLADVARSYGIPVVQDEALYAGLSSATGREDTDLRAIDLVISILHQKRIRRPLIECGRVGCVNFHPAPLPAYRGWGTYNMGILDGVEQWGASAHFVDDDFDTGPLIRVRRFNIDASTETALSLVRKTEPVLLALFKEILEMALQEKTLPSSPQGTGRSFTRRETLARRFITPDDSPDMVDRKIRAFWYPPYAGAQIEVAGTFQTIINQKILADLAAELHAAETDRVAQTTTASTDAAS